MKKVVSALLLSLSLTALMAISSCSLFFPQKQQAPVLSMFPDVPVPPELVIDEKESQVYEHPVGRVGIMRSSGRIEKSAVISYYREVMAQKGWVKDGEFDNGEKQLLIFSKNPRSAAISVSEGWMKTEVEINVSAKEQKQKGLDPLGGQ